ncbi:hypothetical protein ACP3T3_01500 [Chryseobacterium sp. CBSDS_008]|uniref:hypothetical protein n=1 Tax=Chryseobacterium sp. CBSDS_008 TaxID=3415265 RepID=UPI003CEDEBE0
MKKIILLIFVNYINILHSQVGINTSHPIGVFHIDAKGNNPSGTPSLLYLIDDFVIDANGNAKFIPFTSNYNTKLFIYNSSGDNVKIEGILLAEAPKSLSLLGAYRPSATVSFLKREGSIDQLGIPGLTVLELAADINGFLNGVGAGDAQDIPMTMIKNSIDDLTYDASNHTVFLPQGMYQISIVFKANHSGCTISSYFYDFPFNTGFARVHSNTRHLVGTGDQSVHSGKITYTTQILAGGSSIRINLGRGQAGNCGMTGMNLLGNGTQFIINRIGD